MSITKKFSKVLLAVIALLALVGCNVQMPGFDSFSRSKSDAEVALELVAENIFFLQEDLTVTKDLEFTTTSGWADRVTISWESSNPAVISNEGKVTRPLYGEGNATVTVTCTISAEYTKLDDGTFEIGYVTKTLEPWTFTVVEAGKVYTIADIKNDLTFEADVTEVSFEGVVVAVSKYKGGTYPFVFDGTDGMYVYIDSPEVKVGDKVEVNALYDVYYNLVQVSAGKVTVLESGVELPTPEKIAISDVVAAKGYMISETVGVAAGKVHNVDAKVVVETSGGYENAYLQDPFTGERFIVHYETAFDYVPGATGETYLDVLKAYNGKFVNITVAVYDRKDGEERVCLSGYEIVEIAEPQLSDEQKATVIINGVSLEGEYSADFELSADVAWEIVSGTGIELVDGKAVVTQTSEKQTVVLKATATVGEAHVSKEFTVVIPSSKIDVVTPSQALEGLKDAANNGQTVYVGGFITADSALDKYGNFFLEDGSNSVKIYGSFGKDAAGNYLFDGLKAQYGLAPGVYVVVKGTYTTNYNNITGLEIVYASVDASKAAEEVVKPENDTLEVYIHGTITADSALDKYGNFFLEDANGGNIKIYGAFGKDAEGNYIFNSIKEQFGLAPGVKVVVRGTYSANYKNVNGLEIVFAIAGEQTEPEQPTHNHVACPVCGLCTEAGCTGTDAEKCTGHEVVEPTDKEFKEGQAYIISLYQGNLGKTYYFTGAMSTFYYATSEKIEDAAEVYVEIVEGGYHVYFLSGSKKQYLNVVEAMGTDGKSHINGVFGDEALTVYTYSAELKTIVTILSDVEYCIGTRNDKNYTTLGPSASSYKPFAIELIEVDAAPEEPKHEHIVCEVCGKCLDAECPDAKCEGHEVVEPETPSSVKFEFGANGNAAHVDGNDLGASKTYKEEGYALDLFGMSKVYGPAVDAKGNSCIKLGTSKVVGTLSFTVPAEVVEVIIYVAQYKSNKTIVSINGTQYTIDTASNNGEYTAVKVDTTSEKTVVFATVSGGVRCMINTIEFVFGASQPEEPKHEHIVCEVCGKCLDSECPDAKCEGHEEPKPETEHAGTEADPYTATDAYKIIATLEDKVATTDKFYVTGVIKSITEVSASYGNATYVITDGTTDLIIYRGKYLNNEKFTSTDQLAVGAVVVVCGQLVNYGGTYEVQSNNYLVSIEMPQPEEPKHEHIVCEVCGKCLDAECPDAKCEGHEVVEPTVVNKVDFETIKTSNASGDSSYTKTYTTAAGWVVAYSAIQSGGATVMNPQFPVIGSDNTYKAVCLNGKTSAPGSLTSPTLTGGIESLSFKYTKMFTDTALKMTVTVTELATGATQTYVVDVVLPKDEKYVVYEVEWKLETPIAGDYTISFVNNCPSAQNGNKDRITILSVEWVAPAPKEEVKAETKSSVVIEDYAAANGWTNSTLYDTLKVDENVTVSVSGTATNNYGQNTGKYYTNGFNWRIYQAEKPSVTFSVAEGCEIVSVKITYDIANTGTLTLNGEAIASGDVVAVNGSTITFSVGNTGTATNGQARITAIEVIYTK